MKRQNKYLILIIIILANSSHIFCDSIIKKEKYKIDVEIRPGIIVKTTIHVMYNSNNPDGQNIVCLHGFAHTANTYNNWFTNIIDDINFEDRISRVLFIDLPGRGKTLLGKNSDLLLGDLNLYDYASFVQHVLDYFKSQNIHCNLFIAHSMGTMIAQIIQQNLISRQTDLASVYGIEQVLFLAPVLPKELGWQFADNGTATSLFEQYIDSNKKQGTFINYPVDLWISLFFSDSQGIIVADAPSRPEVISNQYHSIESISATLQLVGDSVLGIERTSIDPDIFCNTGCTLWVVSFSEDVFIFQYPGEHRELYSYLTGDTALMHFYTIIGPDAVHDNYILESIQLNTLLLSILTQ